MTFSNSEHKRFSKVFTTGRKRKTTITINHSTIEEKCRQLTEIALNLFPNRIINHEDLKYLVMRHIGGNRDTIRAYVGYLGRRIGSSYGNVKWIGKRRRGYLETFGFMTHKGLKWIIHAQSQLFPPLPPLLDNEGVSENHSIKKISLSNRGSDYTVTNSLTNGEGDVERREKRERDTARERFFSWEMDTKLYADKSKCNCETDANLQFLEKLAKAKPSDVDLARKKCPKIRWNSHE